MKNPINLCKDQDEFIFGNWKYGSYFGEYGNGKTLAGILRARRLSKIQKNSGMVLRKFWGDNRDTTLEQFHELLPEWKKWYKISAHKHELPNGSKIYWRGMDRIGNVEKLNNYNLGWYWMEQGEELFLRCFNILQGRLKLTHVPITGFVTANPAGHNYLWQLFIAPNKNIKYKYFQPPARWNKKNLPENYYEEKEKDWPPELISRFLDGKHDGYEGLLYSCFNENENCYEGYKNIKNEGEWWEAQDYGISKTNPMVWLWIWKYNDMYFIEDEYYKYDCMPDDAAIAVKAKREILNIKEVLKGTTGCPRTFQQEKDKKTPAQYFLENYGIYIEPYPVHLEVRYPIVFGLMKSRKLQISNNCQNLKSEINFLTWQNYKQANNHAIEALERIIAKLIQNKHQGWNPNDYIDSRIERPLTAGLMQMEY